MTHRHHKKTQLIFTLLTIVLIGIIVVLTIPPLSDKAESARRRVESWWVARQPHDNYVPVPSVVVPTYHSTDASPSGVVVPTNSSQMATPPASFKLSGITEEYQKWNNCGPATLTMLLGYFGRSDKQLEIANYVKPNSDDKNVNPWELESYVKTQTPLGAKYRINGDLTMIKQFISHDIPIIVEVWFEREPNDGMGHFRLLYGYDDVSKEIWYMDSYKGPHLTTTYNQFDRDWEVFNRTYLAVYKSDQQKLVENIIGKQVDDRTMWEFSRIGAQFTIQKNDIDPYAWFNLGTTLEKQGKHAEAAQAFDKARQLGLPWRMLWYQFGIFDAYLAIGRNEDVINLTSVNLKQSNDLEESHYYKGKALKAIGKTDEAKKEFETALMLNKNYQAAQQELQ